MAPQIYQVIMRVFKSLLLIFFIYLSLGCGWSESYESTRLVLFKPEIEGFKKLRPFYYTLNLYNATTEFSVKDQELNCKEWRNKLGNNINLDDVNTILYQTSPEQFKNASETKTLDSVFKNNTFVKTLLLPKNKAFLDYMLFAKELEYKNMPNMGWEVWENLSYSYALDFNDIIEFTSDLKKIESTNDHFLKQRYAFLLLRDSFYEQNNKQVIDLYDSYFSEKDKTILATWALYYKALCVDDAVLQNYLLSKVFASSDDKAFAVKQHYDSKLQEQTLNLAKDAKERSVILAIASLSNPSPQLDVLKQVYHNDSKSIYFLFLVGREINKLEDWIFNPKYINRDSSRNNDSEDWYTDYDKARKENFEKDIEYLQNLKEFLIAIVAEQSGEQKDYLDSAIAQLCFIDDEIELGKKYANRVNSKNASIQLQKQIQLTLVALNQLDITKEKTKEIFFNCFNAFENAVQEDNSLLKRMYSLYRMMSNEYFKKGDAATAGLLFMKSENKKSGAYYRFDNRAFFYEYIGYFDRFATIKDIDNLIELTKKENKTDFEKYICSGNLPNDINVYKELKGTLAFRNNDLELASSVFNDMPSDYWKNTYYFSDFLNEDPFLAKILVADKNRKFNYNFNKSKFIDKLIDLKKKNTAEANLSLGHAYFNVSYWGNSWMMSAYDWSNSNYNNYPDYVYGGDNFDSELKYQEGNYYNLKLAKKYFQKALNLAKNDEQKAMASLMLFECNYYAYYSSGNRLGNEQFLFGKGSDIFNLNKFYANTKVFKRYKCPLLEMYIN